MIKSYVWIWVLCILGCQATKESQTSEEWVSLFNGIDLTDWTPKIRGFDLGVNFGETFRITDSSICTNYEAYDSFDQRFGHLFYKHPYSHYRIRISYRFFGEQAKDGPGWAYRNSGIMLHCQDPKTITQSQDFPISIEAQLLGGNGKDPRTTMNLCTPGTEVWIADTLLASHCTSATSKTYHGDQWVEAEALVLGDSLIIHYVEGTEVIRYSKPYVGGGVVNNFNPSAKRDGTPLTEGYISMQSESHPIAFRKVELLDLCGCMDKKAKNFKQYFVCSRPEMCLY